MKKAALLCFVGSLFLILPISSCSITSPQSTYMEQSYSNRLAIPQWIATTANAYMNAEKDFYVTFSDNNYSVHIVGSNASYSYTYSGRIQYTESRITSQVSDDDSYRVNYFFTHPVYGKVRVELSIRKFSNGIFFWETQTSNFGSIYRDQTLLLQ